MRPLWCNTLHGDFASLGHIDVIRGIALTIKYPYFLWNGKVYNTSTGEATEYEMRDMPIEKIV